MKKILHLVCNSHIDPVWQWDWDEGASAALATFYAACNLLDKYDFIFCHNEVLIYEYIERYDPKLFKRIQGLIEQGKWKIMGGWYCQPDCFVPSGESFIRQITLGREYFKEKFNATPRVAINFDSFGHTKGLVQILKKSGYDGYIFCRPLPEYVSLKNFKDYPHGPFLWEGYDGSRIKALRYEDRFNNYTTQYGKAAAGIKLKMETYKDLDTYPVLWGVGNHGGTSSEKDLEDIIVLQNEKKGEYDIIHSSLEDYFDSVNPTDVEKRQIFVFLKAYSSVHAIKLAHDQLENMLYMAERVCSAAEIAGKFAYNKEIFKNAERTLCKIEFHDVLAGTSVKSGTDSSLRKAFGAIDELKQEMYGAYSAMAADLPKVKPGDDNVVLFNPYPFDYDGYVESEYYPAQMLPDYEHQYDIRMYDLNGKSVDYQIIKEESNINIQHRVRVIYKAHIPAFSAVSYGAEIKFVPKTVNIVKDDNLLIKDNVKTILINKETGMIDSYVVEGKEYLSKPGFGLFSFNDNADPWGWRLSDLTCSTFNDCGWPQKEYKNTLKGMKVDNSGKGVFEGLPGVSVVEQGRYLTQVQVLLSNGRSYACINYKIYKDTKYIDISIHLLWNEAHKGLKVKIPLNGQSKYFTQMAFGMETYKPDGVENPGNRYVGVDNDDNCFVVYNKSGIHSYSKKGRDLFITLINGSAFCAHPIEDYLPLTRKDLFVPYADQGVNDFEFRAGVNKKEECEIISQQFCQPIYGTIYFPHGDGINISRESILISNHNIVISALKRLNDGRFIIRLYNCNNVASKTTIKINTIVKDISLKKYEFVTLIYDKKSIVKTDNASLY